jgi:hypothetical protein
MIEWAFVAQDLAFTNKAFLHPHDTRLSFALNGGMAGQARVRVEDDAAKELLIGSRCIRAYRNGVLRSAGFITEPLKIGAEWVEFTWHSPYLHMLSRRYLTELTTFTSTDAGSIARSLITTQNTRGTTQLNPNGAFASSVARSIEFEAGKNVAEAIRQLAELDQGFFFRETPVDNDPTYMAQFDIRYPNPGVDATARGIFEYGEDTRGNLGDLQVEYLLPRNRIIARASGMIATAENAGSISTYRMLERDFSFTDVAEQTILQKHADEQLRPSPIANYTASPLSDNESAALFVPSPWDDFDLGDTVRLRADHFALQVDTTLEVVEFELAIGDDSESELLTRLVLQDLV